jgi:hypothetical protein
MKVLCPPNKPLILNMVEEVATIKDETMAEATLKIGTKDTEETIEPRKDTIETKNLKFVCTTFPFSMKKIRLRKF